MPATTTESLGPFIGERAETLGQGILKIGIYAEGETFTTLDGVSLNKVPFSFTGLYAGALDTVDINVKLNVSREVTDFAATYGLTPDWDIGIVVPIVNVNARSIATATLFAPAGQFFMDTGTAQSSSSSGGDRTGIGDVILRTKYRLLDGQSSSMPDVAVLGLVQAPTGDPNNLLGSGSTDILGEVIASKQLGRFAPHLNIGYEQAIAGVDKDSLRYVVGMDARATSDLTLYTDVVGLKQFAGENLTDFSFGGKFNLFNKAILSTNFLIPVNKDTGLRPDYVWYVGLETVF